jgi:hypothetical protein
MELPKLSCSVTQLHANHEDEVEEDSDMDKIDKKAPTRYYDDILNMEYRVSSLDRFSESKSDRVEPQDARSDYGAGLSRRHQ